MPDALVEIVEFLMNRVLDPGSREDLIRGFISIFVTEKAMKWDAANRAISHSEFGEPVFVIASNVLFINIGHHTLGSIVEQSDRHHGASKVSIHSIIEPSSHISCIPHSPQDFCY